MNIFSLRNRKNSTHGIFHKKRIKRIQNMKIIPHKFFIVAECGGAIKMKPQKFPVLVLQTFIVMMFHAVYVCGSSRMQRILTAVIFQ